MLQITIETPTSRRIQKARTALVLDHPFFGSLLFRLKDFECRSIQTMATDGLSLYYNPEFVETLNAATLAGTLAHEVMHPALHHHVRRSGRRFFPKKNVRQPNASARGDRVSASPILQGQYLNTVFLAFAAQIVLDEW